MEPKEETPTGQQPEKTTPTAADTGQPGQEPRATFTQEQLDAIIRDRLERATQKTKAGIFAELGIGDVEEAKKALADAKKAREAQMSELEKAQAQIAEWEAKAQAAEAEAQATKAQAAEMALKASIIAKAGNFNDPLDAWQFIDRSKIDTGEDGEYKGIDEALKQLAETKPYLLKAGGGAQPAGPGTPAPRRPKSIAERIAEEQERNRPKSTEEIRPTIPF